MLNYYSVRNETINNPILQYNFSFNTALFVRETRFHICKTKVMSFFTHRKIDPSKSRDMHDEASVRSSENNCFIILHKPLYYKASFEKKQKNYVFPISIYHTLHTMHYLKIIQVLNVICQLLLIYFTECFIYFYFFKEKKKQDYVHLDNNNFF